MMTSHELTLLAHTLAPADLERVPCRILVTGELMGLVTLDDFTGGMFCGDAQDVVPGAPVGETCIVLNSRTLRKDSEFIEVLLHELAHLFAEGYRPHLVPTEQLIEQFNTRVEPLKASDTGPLTMPPWERTGEDARWLRAAAHLHVRAKLRGYKTDFQAVATLLPAFQSSERYLAELGDEPLRRMHDPLYEILATTAPKSFRAMWTRDTQPFYSWLAANAQDIDESVDAA